MRLKLWHRLVLGLLLMAAIAGMVWLLAPNGQRAIPALTGVLIAVTVWYADRTHEMVREMRAARVAQVRPKIVPTIDRIAPNAMTPRVFSVGAGPAFDVRVTLALEPEGPSGDYVAAVMRPGRGQALFFRDPVSTQVIATVDEIGQYERVHVTGTCRDALGAELKVDETLDLTAFVAAWKAGLWKRPGATKREGKEPLPSSS